MVLDLDVNGPGAQNVEAPLAFTHVVSLPRPKRLDPAQRHVYEVKRLWPGARRGAGERGEPVSDAVSLIYGIQEPRPTAVRDDGRQ